MYNTNFPYKNEGKTGKCKRNPPHKNKVSMGCVRETPHIKMKPARDVSEKLPTEKKSQHGMLKRNTPDKNEKRNQHGMCNTNFPHKKACNTGCVRKTSHIKTSQHGMCRRNSPDKCEKSMGCVRETPQINVKPARFFFFFFFFFFYKEKLLRQKLSQHGMRKTNFPNKNEVSMGCVRETPQINVKRARDV